MNWSARLPTHSDFSSRPAVHSCRLLFNAFQRLGPDRSRSFDTQSQLGALVSFRDWITSDRTGKSALRADRETRGVDVFCRLVRPAFESIDRFELGRF